MHKRTTTTVSEDLKAKELNENHRISLGLTSGKVVSNQKNPNKTRTLTLVSYVRGGSPAVLTLTLPKNFVVRASSSTSVVEED